MGRYIFAIFALLPSVALAQWEPDWYRFYLPWNDSTNSPTHVARVLGDTTLRGRISVSGDQFIDGKGEPIHFVGVGFLFGALFPSADTARMVANRLSKYGINLVRIQGLEQLWYPQGIWDPAYYPSVTHYSQEALNRLDSFVAALAERGIYVDLDIHVGRHFHHIDDPTIVTDSLSCFWHNYVLYYDPTLIRMTRDYMQFMLERINPYRGMRYADDPAIAMLELTNENSLLWAYLEGWTDEPKGNNSCGIGEPYRSCLDTAFTEWLAERYPSRDSLEAAWNVGIEPRGSNLVRDGNFEALASTFVFEVHWQEGAGGKLVYDNTDPAEGNWCLHAIIDSCGTYAYHLGIKQIGIPVDSSKKYIIRFWGKASAARTCYIKLGRDVSPWDNYGLGREVFLDTMWQRFQFAFSCTETDSATTRLSFNIGHDTADVWLDDVRLCAASKRGLRSYEDPAIFVEHVHIDSLLLYTPARVHDQMQFLYDTERSFYQQFLELRDGIGCPAPMLLTQNYYNITNLASRNIGEIAGSHGYWQHPSFPGSPWDPENWYIRNTPQIGDENPYGILQLEYCAVNNKPFLIGEYNNPHPNFYQCEMIPELFAYAGFWGHDAVSLFAYSEEYNFSQKHWDDFFSIHNDPKIMVQLVPWSIAFRRGDITPSVAPVAIDYKLEDIFDFDIETKDGWLPSLTTDGYLDRYCFLEHAVSRGDMNAEETPPGNSYGISSPTGPVYISDTNELTWNIPDGRFTVDTDGICAAVGYLAGKEISAGRLTVALTEPNFASVTAVALDKPSIAEADSLLITAVGRSGNRNMGWNVDSTSVGDNWGILPTYMEPVLGQISIDWGENGKITYDLVENSPWYLLVRKPPDTTMVYPLYTLGLPQDTTYIYRAPYANHDIGNCIFTVTCHGSCGFMAADSKKGSGFIYPATGENMLYIGSFWVGSSATYVADRPHDAQKAPDWVVTSEPDGLVLIGGRRYSDQDGWAMYDDTGHPSPKGIRITQNSWAWANAPDDDYVIMRYTVENTGTNAVNGLYVGQFMDWDIKSYSDDEAGTDASRRLVYMWGDPYAGIKLLSPTTAANLTVLEWGSIADSVKIQILNGGLSFPSSTYPGDWRVLVSAGPFDLGPGGSTIVAFAIIGGDSLADLQANADAAQEKFNTIIVGIEEARTLSNIPLTFALLQNYPNPFNQETVIRYSLPVDRPAHTTLKIYNITGQLVRTLVDEVQDAGYYTVHWNGETNSRDKVASGVYFYRLSTQGRKAGKFTATKKMIVLK